MRISDWSSDVCSSDLPIEVIAEVPDGLPAPAELVRRAVGYLGDHLDRLRRIEEVEGARRRLARLGRLPGQRRGRVDRGQFALRLLGNLRFGGTPPPYSRSASLRLAYDFFLTFSSPFSPFLFKHPFFFF